MPEYVVQQGDCVSQIAKFYGQDANAVWNHPKNAELRTKRQNMNVLQAGDVVFVPDVNSKEVPVATDARHVFIRKGVPAKLQLRLMDRGSPMANEGYVLDIDGTLIDGKTDGNGWIRRVIPPDAKRGVLRLKDGRESHALRLGYLDPVQATSGIQGRLKGLGYYLGVVDGTNTRELEEALRAFQKESGLEPNGQADDATRAALQSAFGS